MPDDAYTQLIRDIEIEKGRMTAHEGICAERYKNITDKFSEQGTKLDKIVAAVGQSNGNTSRRMIAFLAATIAFLTSVAGWETAKLYDAQPALIRAVDAPK